MFFCLENRTDTQILTAINEKIHEENQVFSLLILMYYKEILYDVMNSTYLEMSLLFFKYQQQYISNI